MSDLKYTFYTHAKSLGVRASEIKDDTSLIRDVVVRARIIHRGNEAYANDRAPTPAAIQSISPYTLTTDDPGKAPKVSLKSLLDEIDRRAAKSKVAQKFTSGIGKIDASQGEGPVAQQIHDKVRENMQGPDGAFWKSLHRAHTEQDLQTATKPLGHRAAGARKAARFARE